MSSSLAPDSNHAAPRSADLEFECFDLFSNRNEPGGTHDMALHTCREGRNSIWFLGIFNERVEWSEDIIYMHITEGLSDVGCEARVIENKYSYPEQSMDLQSEIIAVKRFH